MSQGVSLSNQSSRKNPLDFVWLSKFAVFIGFSLNLSFVFFVLLRSGTAENMTGFGWAAFANTFGVWTAFTAAGVFLGTLFGLPKSQGGDREGQTQDSNGVRENWVSLSPNTSLDQVSDWLTKTLIGAGLTQLYNVPVAIKSVAKYASQGFSGDAAGIANSYFAFMIVYSAITGFLAGYFAARLYLGRELAAADNEMYGTQKQRFGALSELDTPSVVRLGSRADMATESDPKMARVAADFVTANNQMPPGPMTREELIALARANLKTNTPNYRDAISAYNQALVLDPFDADLNRELAYAVYKGIGATPAVAHLDRFLQRLGADAKNVKGIEHCYDDLSYYLFYILPPDHERILAVIEKVDLNGDDGTRRVRKICALAQKYRLEAESMKSEARTQLGESVLKEITDLLVRKPDWQRYLYEIWDPKARRVDHMDNDLEPFYVDQTWRARFMPILASTAGLKSGS